MGVFVTSGFPDAASTLPILDAIVAGGADFIELGMPFSDPLAEGVPIQRSSERALRGGANLARTLQVAQEFTTLQSTPLVLMGYYNPILQYGISNFCRDAESCGIAGLIIPDLPPEEAMQLELAARKHNVALTYLIAPNSSDDRISLVGGRSTGFVYAVSTTGVTGGQANASESVDEYLRKAVKLIPNLPLLVGFGIRTRADAVKLSRHTDGFIVGSALVAKIESLWKEDLTLEERTVAITDFVYNLHPSNG